MRWSRTKRTAVRWMKLKLVEVPSSNQKLWIFLSNNGLRKMYPWIKISTKFLCAFNRISLWASGLIKHGGPKQLALKIQIWVLTSSKLKNNKSIIIWNWKDKKFRKKDKNVTSGKSINSKILQQSFATHLIFRKVFW